MAFAGDLQKLPLADVFQSIHQNGLTGALAVRDTKGERLVSFDSGLVTGCADVPDKIEDVADELVRQRKVSPKDVKRGQSRFFKRKGTLKRSLSRRRLLESGEYDMFARSVVLERIYEIFLLEEGSFEFIEDYDQERFSEDECSAGLRIAPGEILMEAMRRIDEWGRIRRSIPSFKEVYAATRDPSDEDEELERELIQLTRGGDKDLDTVLSELPAARFTACEAVLALVEKGALRVATSPEYLDLGKEAEAKGDLSAAADFYERGLHYERGNAGLNERLIAVLEKLERNEDAARERKVYAGTLLEHGDTERASAQYAAAARLAPSDPLPLERLLVIQIEREKSYEKARETAKRLVELYLRIGLGDKAKGVYPRVLALRPKDRWLRERLAEVHVELNENGTAAAIFKELAQEELKQDATEAAAGLLRRAVELAPEDSKGAALLEELETGQYKALRRRRRVFALAMFGLIALGLSAAWGVYEVQGLIALRRASEQAVRSLYRHEEGALTAVEVIEAAREGYPHTRASAWGRELIVGLSSHYAEVAREAGQRVVPIGAPELTLPAEQVEAQLRHALDPKDGTKLNELIDQAEAKLDGKDPAAARKILAEEVRPRLDRALDALRRATPNTRKLTSYEIDLARVRDLLPAFQLAWGEATFTLPEARETLRAARAQLHVEQNAEKGVGVAPTPGATPPAKTEAGEGAKTGENGKTATPAKTRRKRTG
ncbi:MAG TPA: hypothetical protein DEA08_01455 [Planctomycetes bacterium]|nr:hypothetical protein [Planctomycetota bacterium]